MKRYRSRPSEVEAVQWTGDPADFLDLEEFAPVAPPYSFGPELHLHAGKNGAQGWVPVPEGHWIVRNPDDPTDYWPVDPDYFAGKYEEAR